jgi:hypothetical protein
MLNLSPFFHGSLEELPKKRHKNYYGQNRKSSELAASFITGPQ